jgi:hypothetical protein
MTPDVKWPGGRRFAFTIFDDPDAQSLDTSRRIYGLLEDLGFRTTKAVWVVEPPERNSPGETCESRDFLAHSRDLQAKEFEIAYHNGAPGTLQRNEVIRSLELFRTYFAGDPVSMANHYNGDAMYWGDARLSGPARLIYKAVTRRPKVHYGHVEGHPCFWGDVCRERIRYCRNFVFRRTNTLSACPYMPYADPAKPYVNAWYAASEGPDCTGFLRRCSEREQDRLEREGGACIMYTHFGHGFVTDGRVNAEFKRLMQRLAARNGWFVPAGTLLGYLERVRGIHTLTASERNAMERAWLAMKLVHGTS